MKYVTFAIVAALVLTDPSLALAQKTDDIYNRVTHGYANNNGVKIHYATVGRGPLIVMVHGYPDFWYSWRHQMAVLSKEYQVVAIDQRGYNLSDKPKGQEQYDLKLLVDDLHAVIQQLGRNDAIIVGHDWGARVAWEFAGRYPEMTRLLITCNGPNPRGIARERAHNAEQQAHTAYAQRLKQRGSENTLTAEGLAGRIQDPLIRQRYVEAFKRSDFEAMVNYYRQNYPDEPYIDDTSPIVKIKAPVLIIHGMKDTAVMYPALNGTWDWVDRDVTITTVPEAGHFVQNDAADQVSKIIKAWLDLHRAKEAEVRR
jgi:pimeloyl-ACP methyl ester carboxylesterase